MDRFDIPEKFANVLDAYGCDSRDVYALSQKHGTDYRSAAWEVVEWAYAGIHHDPEKHERVSRAFDDFYASL